MGSNEIAEIIHAAIDPDNLTEPPMVYDSVCAASTLIFNLRNVKSVETTLATLIDLLSAVQVTENILKLHNSV